MTVQYLSKRKIAEPLTNEDLDVWDHLFKRWGSDRDRVGIGLFYRSRDADRRDADLMLTLTRARQQMGSLKETAQSLYDTLTPKEQEVMRRLWGTERPK